MLDFGGCFGFAIGFEVAIGAEVAVAIAVVVEGEAVGGRRCIGLGLGLELELGAGVGVVRGTFCMWMNG